MRVHGVLMVRNAVHSVRAALLHHLSLGCERIHVVDNGSTDGTATVLRRLSERTPITWTSDPGPFVQHTIVTGLVHQAARWGADWVVPFDADEFWVSQRPLHDVLAQAGDAGAVEVPLVNFAQRREVARLSPRVLLTMDHRAPETVEPILGQELVEAGSLSFLEFRYPPKLILRASERVDVQRGAHWSKLLEGPIAPGPGVEILHAPLAALQSLHRKARHGERVEEAGYVEREGWHVRRWAALARQGRLEEDWASVSVDGEGFVELADGSRRRFVRDTRLRDTVARYIRPPVKQAVARALSRSY